MFRNRIDLGCLPWYAIGGSIMAFNISTAILSLATLAALYLTRGQHNAWAAPIAAGLRGLVFWRGALVAVTLFLNGYVLWFQFWGPGARS